MTLDYCFFCHDKKHFCVVKGHFCSFLVSSIYWLTSLSTDLRMQLWSGLSFHFCTNYFIHSFLFKREALNLWELIWSCCFDGVSVFSFVLLTLHFCTSSAFRKSFCFGCQRFLIVLHRDLIVPLMDRLLISDDRIIRWDSYFRYWILIFEGWFSETFKELPCYWYHLFVSIRYHEKMRISSPNIIQIE